LLPLGLSESLTDKMGLPEDGANERRNTSVY
jgi:hypothetical protein